MLSDIQLRVERSVYEAIRLVLVSEGYIPDLNNNTTYPKDGNGNLTVIGQQHWDTDLKVIQTAKGFAIDIFSNSSSKSKGIKKVPRITIEPSIVTDGDLGLPVGTTTFKNPLDPNSFVKTINPLESTHLNLEIHLISDTAAQERILNAVLAKVLGIKKYIVLYDSPDERFFIRRANFSQVPDPIEGVSEKVYTYEIQDLYLFSEENTPISLMSQFTLEIDYPDNQTETNIIT